MDFNYTDLVDEQLVDECDQIRAIAKKSWLSGAAVSLAHLDNVKTNVYNFGIADPKDLKATNLRNRKPKPPFENLNTEPPLSATSSQHGNVAWGSNSSIPDLLRQQNIEKAPLPKPTRPGSAKYSNTRIRPPSGKKPRPQSAKECVEDIVSQDARPGFGVRGAKYDPNGRPPKGVPNVTTTGWVGPPAGLKYPDKPPVGAGWKIEFPEEADLAYGEPAPSEPEIPPPPCTTPMPPTPEPEKPKRVFELYIGDPYSVNGADDEDLYEDSDEELAFVTSTHHTHISTEPHGSHIESHTHHTAPPSGTSSSSIGLGDQRESLKLNLPTADDDYDEIDEVDTDRLLAEAESVSQKLDLKSIISANKNIRVPSSQDTNSSNDTGENTEKESEASPDIIYRKKAESLVNTIISENGLTFDKNDATVQASCKHIAEHEKSSVKFNEDVTTVNITPRNIGRKVDELHNKKKTFPTKDSGFIDLIEVKSRMEPVLSTGKADLSPRRNRPPSGKSKTAVTVGLAGTGKHTVLKSNRSVSPVSCLKNHVTETQTKPREPLNRAPKPITTVTVDYGQEETQEKSIKQKKKRKKSDDIVTMMEKINLENNSTRVPVLNLQDFDTTEETQGETVLETKCKSEPEKNYYEISRHSSMSNHSNVSRHSSMSNVSRHSSMSNTSSRNNSKDKESVHGDVINTQGNTVYKTTKTIEFNDVQPKEVTVKSVLDAQVLKEAKQFTVRPPSRPTSTKPPKKPAQAESTSAPDRPGSRLGFVAMAPSGNNETQNKNKTHTRPWSAPVHRRPLSGQKSKPKQEKKDTNTATSTNGQDMTEEEKAEREKVIENLLDRTRGLLENGEKKDLVEEPKRESEHVERKKTRPVSAHTGLASRAKDQGRLRSAINRRPASATTTRTSHKHYANYSTSSGSGSRKSSAKSSKVIKREPLIITSNTPYLDEESETEEDLACQEMHKQLANRGVNITADTLQRALYPPSGRTKYYHINADLPKKSSISLLSHPKVWLSEEYRRLQKAEKTLARANEIMFLQEKAEKRRAMLEALGPEERKKLLKKKGKKGAKKLRKSKTIA